MTDSVVKEVFKKASTFTNEDESHTESQIFNSKLYFVFENLSNYGPTSLLTPVLNLLTKCIDLNPKKRPCIEWMLVILK